MPRPSFDDIIQTAQPRPSFTEITKSGEGAPSFAAIVSTDEPIGFVERITDNPWEMIPTVKPAETLHLYDTAKRIQNNDYGDYPETAAPVESYPFGFDDPRYVASEAQRRFAQEAGTGQLVTASEQKRRDVETMADYFADLEEKGRRGYTFGGEVGNILSQMAPWAIEYVATSGLGTIGKRVGKGLATKALRRYATTTLGKAAIGTGGFATGVTLRAAGLPHRAAASVAQRQIPKDMRIKDDGTVEFTEPGEGPTTSVIKGLADHWIEIATESAGEYLGPAIKKTFGGIAKHIPLFDRLLPRMRSAWASKTGKSLAEFNKRVATLTGFHGVVGELGEEWLGNNVKAIATIEDFGAGPDASYTDKIIAANKSFYDSLPAMTAAFLVPTGARAFLGVANTALEKKVAERAKLQQRVDVADSMAYSVPTQIETAEGTLGYLPDVLKAMEPSVPGVVPLKKTGLGKYLTNKWLVNRLIGAETFLEDVEAAHTSMLLERNDVQGWINKITRKLRKEKQLTQLPEILEEQAHKEAQVDLQQLFQGEAEVERPTSFLPRDAIEGTKAHILQKKIDTMSPVAVMRDLLDTYEDAPSFLNEEEASIFNRIRALTRYMLDRVNRAREARGEEPIQGVGSYITHWIDAAASEKMEQRIAAQAKKRKKLSKQVPNYTAERRKIKDELTTLFSKDLGRLLQQMAKYDLRDIYLTKPYQTALAELNTLDKSGLVPPETYKTVEDYLRYDIREMPTPLDKMFNTTMQVPADLLKRLSFGKVVIDDPARQVLGTLRNLGFLSGLGGRLKNPTRNLGQRLLLLDLYRHVDYLQAQTIAARLAPMPQVEHPITGGPVPFIDLLREQPWYQATLQHYEDIVSELESPSTRIREAGREVKDASLYAYSKSHAGNLFLSNVEVSALTGYLDWQYAYEQSQPGTEHYKRARREAMKLNIPVEQLLTQKEDMLPNIREAVRRTQWEYFTTSMPTLYRGQVMRAGFQFQSWWQNYFFNHFREMTSQFLTGRTSRGRLIPGNGRLRGLKGMGTIVALGKFAETALDIAVLKFLFLPDISRPLSAPIPNFIVSVLAFMGAKTPEERKAATTRLKNALKFWVPYSLALKDIWDVLSGEQDFSDLLFYKK